MNDRPDLSKAFGEVATRNAQAALEVANNTKSELTMRVNALENLVTSLNGQIAQLQQKYNLLLSSRFNGGSTSE